MDLTETSLIGAVINNEIGYDAICELISYNDFETAENQLIFKTIQKLYNDNEPVDPVTVSNALNIKQHKADRIFTHLEHIGTKYSNTSIKKLQSYAEIIKEESTRRQIKELSYKLNSYAEDKDVNVITESLNAIDLVVSKRVDSKIESITDETAKVINEIKERSKQPNQVLSGIPTGFFMLDNVTDGLQRGDFIIIAARPSVGKALRNGSLVKTLDGWSKIEALKIGDSIASIDGKESKVIGVYPQGITELYEITFSDGRKSKCCPDHLWQVGNRKWKEDKILSTKEIIKLKDEHPSYVDSIYIPLEVDYSGFDNFKVDPYLMGCLLGDGSFANGTPRFSTNDEEIIYTLSHRLFEGMTLNFQNSYDWSLSDDKNFTNRLTEILKEYGLQGKNSFEKFIPEPYMVGSFKTRLEIIQGLMDTDGTITKTGCTQYSTASKKMAEQFQQLVRSLGCWAKIKEKEGWYTYKGEKLKGRTNYIVTFSSLEKPFKLERKLKRVKEKQRNKKMKISYIKKIDSAESTCISVSHESKLFFTNDYVVTHNTAMLLNLIKNIAKKGNVIFFSLEMSQKQLVYRMLADVSGVEFMKIFRGRLTQAEQRLVDAASDKLKNLHVAIDDRGGVSVDEIRSRARVYNRRNPLDLIAVDYLSLISGKGENRTNEIGYVSRQLKLLAKECQAPVVCLSQLSRAVEQRQDKRPLLTDLRESGAIEQDADIVAFLYRDKLYNPDTKLDKYAELVIRKNRNGETGTIWFEFDGGLQRFTCVKEPKHILNDTR